MTSAHARSAKVRAKSSPYRQIKVYTIDGRASTISLDKNLYSVIEHKAGSKATVDVARKAARAYDPAKTNKSRSAFVVAALQETFGIARTAREEAPYVKLRVKRANGEITTVSFPPPFMARVRRHLSEEEIQRIADDAAARYDNSVPFTRSEHIKRALKARIGEKVPSEIKLTRAKFKLSTAELASILQVSEKEITRWEERGQIDSGPARAMLAAIWKKRLKLSAVLERKPRQVRTGASRGVRRTPGTRAGAGQ